MSWSGLLRGFGAVAMPAALAAVISSDASPARTTTQLSFAERVQAQEAIERVYYSHQIGATKPFEELVPREALERKVRTYLGQSIALERMWKTPVTAQMLLREAERMARGSRMPERLAELHAALGDDPVLILECLVRPSLVDRLARNFYAFDARIHDEARRAAEALRRQIDDGQVDPSADDPRRTVMEITRDDRSRGDSALPMPLEPESRRPADPVREALSPERFDRMVDRLPAEPGRTGPVEEEHDTFQVRIALEREPDLIRTVSYRIAKRSWDDWWASVESELAEADAPTVALEEPSLPAAGVSSLPREIGRGASALAACGPNDSWDNGTLDDTPDGRESHTAVWTGSLMIVWGGRDGYGVLGSGGRYDPATDTWTQTSTANAASARYSHTAVWTGSEMIVWGGCQTAACTLLNTGGRYDPTTDTWAPITVSGAPSARRFHTAIWTGSLMVVWGGFIDSSGLVLNTGGRYDPASDSWTTTSGVDAPEGRHSHTAVWTGSQMVVWGGKGSGPLLNTGGRYDPVNDSWTPTSTMSPPVARRGHSAVWSGGLVVIWGGLSSAGQYLSSGGRYDPGSDSWTPTSNTNTPLGRTQHTAVWTGSRMVIWGGSISGTDLATGGRYDPATDTWTPASAINAPSARSFHTVVWTGSLMVVWGGNHEGGFFNTGGRYDPAADTWTPTSGVGSGLRYLHTAVWTGSQMIVWGGSDDVSVLGTGSRYDPATDAWTPTSTTNAPSARSGHSAVWTGSLMIVWGGSDNVSSLDTGGRYNPTTDTWSATFNAHAPAPRYSHTAVWTGTQMVVWGGLDGFLNTGGLYDPDRNRWTSISTTNAPSGRYGHTAVWTGSRMVIWGGYPGYVNTGGRYDPATDIWTPTSTTNAPLGRYLHSAVWTGSLMIVFGGAPDDFVGTGGRYDPAIDTWSPTSTMNAPLERYSHTAVWTGTHMIVWGGGEDSTVGTGGRYHLATDTWTPTSLASAPSRRFDHTAVWTDNLMIVSGGQYDTVFDSGGRYVMLPDQDGDGFAECAGDCDVGNAAVYPGAPQICDGLNNDCVHPQWPLLAGTNELDDDGDTQSECAGDCDDGEPSVYLGAPETCDGLATDCADPAYPGTPAGELDSDGDGYRVCAGALPIDCLDTNGNAWALPAEAQDLIWTAPYQLAWSLPDPPGGVPPFRYSQVRSPAAGDFLTGATCLAASGSNSLHVDDVEIPPPGGIFYYLVRARNGCGYGPWGYGSGGGPEPVWGCP